MNEFNKVKSDAPQNLVMGAGMILSDFDVTTETYEEENILFTTTGGVNITAVPTIVDFGEDIDNMPKNTKEMMVIESWECKITGSSYTATAAATKMLLPGSIIDSTSGKITLSKELKDTDFNNLWWVGSKKNGGMVAVLLKNALSMAGFNMQTTDKAKGTFALDFTGTYSIDAQDDVPMEIYIKEPTETV